MHVAAASARLCVETAFFVTKLNLLMQPPPRGCVLKPQTSYGWSEKFSQPPPRGCVLKRLKLYQAKDRMLAAASARLCVETRLWAINWCLPMQPPPRGCVLKLCRWLWHSSLNQAAASARLCVETALMAKAIEWDFAATFGWLCVETSIFAIFQEFCKCSLLRVAVCWNCVVVLNV